MRRLHPVYVAAALVLTIWASACSRGPAPGATTGDPPTPQAISGGEAAEKEFEDFDPNDFDRSTTVDNAWYPLRPGTQFVYEGFAVEDGERLDHRLVITVTDLTKIIAGVRSVVTYDLDHSDGALVEAELAFFAQDDHGAVWRMGEYPEEYEDGVVVDAPTWIHGLQGARAGIAMPMDPRPGTRSYSQGWGPAVDFTDRWQVDQVGLQTCVPADCYENVLVINEFSQAEPDAFQLKHYARGVGNVRVDWKGADQTQETLELVEVVQLGPEALAQIRAQALELENSAYRRSLDVYARTSPLEWSATALVNTDVPAEEPPVSVPEGPATDVIVYASDLPESALSEFDFWDDPASPGGRLVGIPNTGDELDAPLEDDPHVTFKVPVQGRVPYRCWIHMKVGAPKGLSTANVLWVQFTDAVDRANQAAFGPGTGSYLTAQGPATEGWAWVGCDLADSGSAEPLIYFRASGEVTVRLQAGMEGVGFDQFVLSPAQFLEQPPAETIVGK